MPLHDDDRYFNHDQLIAYSGLSDRTLRRALADRVHPLPAYRVGARVLVKKSEFDAWVAAQPVKMRRKGLDMAARVERALARSRG